MTAVEHQPDAGVEYQPVAVASRYERPSRGIDPDASKPWWRRIMPLWLAHKRVILVTLVFGLLWIGSQVLVPRVVMGAIDTGLEDRALDEVVGAVTPFVAALVVLALVRLAAGRIYRYALQATGRQIEYDLRVLLYEHFNRLSFSYYDRVSSGQLISRANSDVRALERFLSFGPSILWQSFTFFLAFGIMVAIHAWLAIATVIPLFALYYVGQRMRQQMFPASWIMQARQADVATVVEENTAGVRIVKSFAAEPEQVDHLARQAQRLQWAGTQQQYVRARFGPLIENLPRASQLVVLGLGGWLAIEGQVTVGTIVAFSAWVVMLQMPFRAMGFLVMMAQRAAASTQRIFEIFDEVPAIEDRPDAVDLADPAGHVEFRDVTFAYTEGVRVLHDLSLSVEPGETVAVVGRTGSGKSTVVRLVPRFYDVDGGQVLLDGLDVRDITLRSLRHNVGYVMDEPFLFSDTIRDNIAYGRLDASQEEVEAAARAAGAHEFVERLPDGYDTIVGERGYTLSGGQRQRIAIARTLLDNPPVLILDDATSNVDVHTEQRIFRSLRELMHRRTTLIVAHRLSTIALADRVVLIEGGRVVETGSHEELLGRSALYRTVLANVEEEEERQSTGASSASEGQRPEPGERVEQVRASTGDADATYDDELGGGW